MLSPAAPVSDVVLLCPTMSGVCAILDWGHGEMQPGERMQRMTEEDWVGGGLQPGAGVRCPVRTESGPAPAPVSRDTGTLRPLHSGVMTCHLWPRLHTPEISVKSDKKPTFILLLSQLLLTLKPALKRNYATGKMATNCFGHFRLKTSNNVERR